MSGNLSSSLFFLGEPLGAQNKGDKIVIVDKRKDVLMSDVIFSKLWIREGHLKEEYNGRLRARKENV